MWKDNWEQRLVVAYFSSTHPCALYYVLKQWQFPDAVTFSVKAFPSSSPKGYTQLNIKAVEETLHSECKILSKEIQQIYPTTYECILKTITLSRFVREHMKLLA